MPCGLTLGSWLLDDGSLSSQPAPVQFIVSLYACFIGLDWVMASLGIECLYCLIAEKQSSGIQPTYCTQTDYSGIGPLLSTPSMPSFAKAKAPQYLTKRNSPLYKTYLNEKLFTTAFKDRHITAFRPVLKGPELWGGRRLFFRRPSFPTFVTKFLCVTGWAQISYHHLLPGRM